MFLEKPAVRFFCVLLHQYRCLFSFIDYFCLRVRQCFRALSQYLDIVVHMNRIRLIFHLKRRF